MLDRIEIRGAREHNLKNIDLDIPHDQLTVISGVSGSGKSSLAFDILYAEGQRRYIESLSTYTKQFLERIARPDVDDVAGISPSIAIQQKNTTRSSRSTVGTTTEIYDYLRLLFARVGRTVCPNGHGEVIRREPEEAVDAIIRGYDGKTVIIFATVPTVGGAARALDRLTKQGYTRLLWKDSVVRVDETPRRNLVRAKEFRVVLDRIVVSERKRTRLFEAVETAYGMSGGFVWLREASGGEVVTYTQERVCTTCGNQFEEPRPILFSFNTPYGACPDCRGFGDRMEFDEALIVPNTKRSIREYAIEPWASEKFGYYHEEMLRFCRRQKISIMKKFCDLKEPERKLVLWGADNYIGVLPFLEDLREKTYKKYARFFTRRYLAFRRCRLCEGGRLRREAYNVHVSGRTICDVAAMVPGKVLDFVESLQLSERETTVAKDIVIELRSRLKFMLDVGLYYLTLSRLTRTLSGGEAQRINLANSLGANLVGVLYVLDEPSVGLHSRDTTRLTRVLNELRDRGNTVVVVEHDLDIIRQADYLIDLGPGAGRQGGEVLYQGELGKASSARSKTIKYLSTGVPIRLSKGKKPANGSIGLLDVSEHNLKHVDVWFPLGQFTTVTGVSGSGKSTLVCDVLYNALKMHDARHTHQFREIVGKSAVNRVMLVDQAPIGKTPRSNPITYIKAFAHIREIFAAQKAAVERRYASGRFSFNVPGGRCARCDGMGFERVEMHFMADLFVRCSECDGRRFNTETLEITYRGKNIADVLDMTVEDALSFFGDHPPLVQRLNVLARVGLGYLQLGQSSPTLSGGESQRIKIARELSENTEGGCVYILDEPTTGLHIDDIDLLVKVLRELLESGNTTILVEHNPQVIFQSDYIIDLGPDGGADGGEIVVAGTPAQVMKARESHTGNYLKRLIEIQKKGAT
ncbi:MAG: excinuclease ABC subunit UvrA [bacterium]|nr:excinuclease ABC subunit UvrA [bacterium]